MKKETITYQTVSKVCNELIKVGEKPSVRKIHKQIGGSFSTISEFLQQWQAQATLAKSVDTDLSDEFRQAILAEFGRVTEAVKTKLQADIDQRDERIKEMQHLLAEQESDNNTLHDELLATREVAKAEQLRLEKALSTAQAETAAAEKRETHLQTQVSDLQNKCHQAELRAAVADTKYQTFENRQNGSASRKR